MLLSVNYAPVTVSHQVVKFCAVFWRGDTELKFLLSALISKHSPAPWLVLGSSRSLVVVADSLSPRVTYSLLKL